MKQVVLKINKLQQAYMDQLLKAGVDFQRAEQAAIGVTREELLLICEIWPEWAIAFSRTENGVDLIPASTVI